MKTVTVFRLITLVSVLFVGFPQLRAQTTIASGNWSNASIWSTGSVPSSSATVTIAHSVTVNSGNVSVNSMTIDPSGNSWAGIIVNANTSLSVSGQIYSATSAKKFVRINVAGTLTAGSVNLNNTSTVDDLDSITVYQGGTFNCGQFLYSRTSGKKGGLELTCAGTINITGGLQQTIDTDRNSYTWTIESTGVMNITGYTIFTNKGNGRFNWYVLGNMTFNSGYNLYGEASAGETLCYIGDASNSGKITTYGTITFRKTDNSGLSNIENVLNFRNGEYIVNGQFNMEINDGSPSSYNANQIQFDNSGSYSGKIKKFTVKGKLFPYTRPFGRAVYTNMTAGNTMGFFISGSASPTVRPDENGNFQFHNLIIETAGDATLEGALSNSNMTGTLTVNNGARLLNGSSSSSAISMNSYAGQININGTLVNVNTPDNIPFQSVSGTSTQVMTLGSNSVIEYYNTSGYAILTGSSFNIPTVNLTGTGDKYLQQSLDASTRKVGKINHQKGLFRIGYQAYQNITIDFKLFNNTSLASNAKTLVVDSGATVNIPMNFTTDPDFLLSANAYSIFTYDMGYHASIAYQKVYAPYSDLAATTVAPYGILKISDSNKGKQLESNKTIKIQNYLEVTGGVTFTINTGSKVILNSTSTMTAYIPAISGTIAYSGTGKIQVQKYISFGTTYNYRDFTTPIKTATLSDWQNAGMIFSGITGSNYPSYTNYTYTYGESTTGDQDQGFTAATNITNNVISYDSNQKITRSGWRTVQGATGGSTVTLQDEGSIFQGDVDFNLGFTSGGVSRTVDDGWNFIGNPYPAVISWANIYSDRTGSDLMANNTTNGISPTIYVWMPEDGSSSSYKDGSYTYYNAATGVGETNISTISQYQGFFVKTYNSSASTASYNLRIREAHKVSGSKSFQKSNVNNNQLLVDIDIWDDYETADKVSFHKWDGASLGNDPIYDVAKMGAYYQDWVQVEFAQEADPLFLKVNALDQHAANLTIPVWFKAGYPGTHHLKISNIEQFSANYSCAMIKDMLTGETFDLNQLGQYDFESEDTQGSVRFQLIFSNAKISGTTEDATCSGEQGKVVAKLKNNTSESAISLYKGAEFVRSFAAGTHSINEELSVGSYTLSIDGMNTCPSTKFDFKIAGPDVIVPEFSVPQLMVEDRTVSFTNQSTGATSYHWTFGDGEQSYDENPEHVFAESGQYTVKLTAIINDGACSAEKVRFVEISTTSGIAPGDLKSLGLSHTMEPGVMNLVNPGSTTGEIKVFMNDGRLFSASSLQSGMNQIQIPQNNIVQVVVTTGTHIGVIRVFGK